MSAESVFATLTPNNVLAKLAFSEAVEHTSVQGSPLRRYMSVGTEQVFDGDVAKYLRHSLSHDDPESAASLSLTEPDTDTEQDLKQLGMIWKGRYTFDLDVEPTDPSRGWVIGTVKGSEIDFLLGGRPRPGIRHRNAIFNMHNATGYIYVLSRGSTEGPSRVAVNGENVPQGSTYALNQKAMKVNIGPLDYVFDYTGFCHTQQFRTSQHKYAQQHLGIEAPQFDMTPTPSAESWVFAGWTINKSVGRGASGKVYSATDSKNRIAAVKVIERRPNTNTWVQRQLQTLEEITALAQTQDDEGRLLRLHDHFYQGGRQEYPLTRWEDIALVLQPLVAGDFSELVKSVAMPNRREFSRPFNERMRLFRDALQGVQFLHSHGWLHSDLKPGNIGIYDNRAVLLDIESSTRLQSGEKLPPRPGNGGTISYLAPEREMEQYDLLVDVWSMGIVGYELIYGEHPWKLANNPWRPGALYENLRPIFHVKYEEALNTLRQRKDPSAVQTRDLLIQMLTCPYARDEANKQERINIHQVLQHPCWLFEEDERASKRVREDEA